MSDLLSLGHGYAARHIVPVLPDGWRVTGSTRDAAHARVLQEGGIDALIWDPAGEPAPLAGALSAATHLISSIAPDRGGADPVLPVLAPLPAPRLRWVGYLSASSVYGDTGGAWIDEDAPANPGTERGKARLAAEEGWRDWCTRRGLTLAIFRIAGIYGPGRSAIEALKEGRARRLVRPGHVFNRIHVTDLGRIIAAAAAQQADGIFNLCDDLPAPPQDLITHAAALTGLPCPPEEPYDSEALSPMARSFYSENKRLRSRRVGSELGVTLHYPDYRSGLAAIIAHKA